MGLALALMFHDALEVCDMEGVCLSHMLDLGASFSFPPNTN